MASGASPFSARPARLAPVLSISSSASPAVIAYEAVTARKNAVALANLAREVRAQVAVVADHSVYRELKDALAGTNIEAASGEEALHEAGQRPADWVMAAISGAIGLKPTLAAIERGATVALANKECLVCAGSLFMRKAASAGANGAAGR